jgi:hypothetical protein
MPHRVGHRHSNDEPDAAYPGVRHNPPHAAYGMKGKDVSPDNKSGLTANIRNE